MMRRYLNVGILMFACLFAFSLTLPNGTSAQEEDEAVPWVFLLAGQSNMVGWGMQEELPQDMREWPGNIEYHSYVGGGTPFKDKPRFGPEIGFAHAMAAAFPDQPMLFIKDGTGGTSLYAWAPEYDAEKAAITKNEKSGALYQKYQNVIKQVVGDREVKYRAVLWMQGERDSKMEPSANEYAKNLETLIEAFRRDTASPDLPFLFGQVNPPKKSFPYVDKVRAAQSQVAENVPGAHLIATDDLSKRDGVHYNTAGQLELGRRFAKAFVRAIEKDCPAENRMPQSRGLASRSTY